MVQKSSTPAPAEAQLAYLRQGEESEKAKEEREVGRVGFRREQVGLGESI